MAVTAWLVDESALVRLPYAVDRDLWQSRLERRPLRITVVTLERLDFA